MQSGSPYDEVGYVHGLYSASSSSLNFDGSSAPLGTTVKLHHGAYEADPGYGAYPMGRSSYLPKDPPPYHEAAGFHAGFSNQASSFYRLPPASSRPCELLDFGGNVVSTTTPAMRLTDSFSPNVEEKVSLRPYLCGEETKSPSSMGGVPGGVGMTTHSERLEMTLTNMKVEADTSNPSVGFSQHRDMISPLPSPSLGVMADPPESSTHAEKEKENPNSEPAEEGGEGEGKEEAKEEDDESKKGGNATKPPLSYIALIAKAILDSPTRRLNLASIYSWIEGNYPYFLKRGQGWRNSVRHNLSLNDCFIKNGRCEDGKGNYWAIHPVNLEDFIRGDFRQRRRTRRRGRNKKDAELDMFMTQNGYLHHGGSSLSHQMAFNTTGHPFHPLYAPYTEAERHAYRLDDVLLRQSANNPFMKSYPSPNVNGMASSLYNSPVPQGSNVNPTVYGATTTPQWGQSYSDQPPTHPSHPTHPNQPFYPTFGR